MNKLKLRKNLPLIVTGVLALGVLGAAAYVHQSRPKGSADTTPANSVPSASSDHAGAGSSASGAASTTPTPTPPPTAPTDPKYSGTSLQAPTGQLISNHTIKLNGSGATDSPAENSTCTTVPGATCTIRLTGPDGTIKYAVDQPMPVDSNGGAAFDWNAQTRGLTPGKWKVEAVAAKDGQTAVSAADYLTVN